MFQAELILAVIPSQMQDPTFAFVKLHLVYWCSSVVPLESYCEEFPVLYQEELDVEGGVSSHALLEQNDRGVNFSFFLLWGLHAVILTHFPTYIYTCSFFVALQFHITA